jgi:hypothetical protein
MTSTNGFNNPSPSPSPLYSRFVLSRILEHFFSSPNHEHHTQIIRKRNLLDLERPRPTRPALLFSILCRSFQMAVYRSLDFCLITSTNIGVACYMPKRDCSAILPNISHGEFISLRRHLLSRTLELLQPVMLAEVEPSFDDAVASFMLMAIGASDDENQHRLLHWSNFCKFIIRKLNLNIEPEGYDEEEKEERRRYAGLAEAIKYLSYTWTYQIVEIVVGSLHNRPPHGLIFQSARPDD